MSTKIEILKEVITKGNKEQTLMVLEDIESKLTDELVAKIIDPATITELHKLLIEKLSVNPAAMKLRRRVPLRKQRAILFLRAMKNGVKKTDD